MNKIKHCCVAMSEHIERGEIGLVYVEKLREYGLEYQDGGSSVQLIGFCPWCGKKLPDSLRERWFCELEALGIDPFVDEVPDAFKSDKWWSSNI